MSFSMVDLVGVRLFDVEASSRCNLACTFCSRSLLSRTGLMSRATYSCFLDHVPLRRTDELTFAGLGEPLLNPHLPHFVAEAKRRYPGTHTRVITNGTLLDEQNVLRLAGSGVDVLDISVNGLDPRAYAALTGGADFHRTVSHVRAAAGLVRRYRFPTELIINFIVTKDNADSEAEIRAFWRRQGVRRFRVQRMHTRAGTVSTTGRTPVRQGLNGFPCAVFKVMTFVSWEGEVFLCSHDMHRRHKFGDVRSEDWSALSARKKRLLQTRDFPAICNACTDGLRFSLEGEIRRTMGRAVLDRVVKMLTARARKWTAAGKPSRGPVHDAARGLET